MALIDSLDALKQAAHLPLLELGARANAVREQAFGNRTYYSADPAPSLELALPTDPDLMAERLWAQREAGFSSVEPRINPTAGETTGEAEIRALALARLIFPPSVHMRANWSALTDAIAQVALRFGADELAGFPADLDRREISRAIREAGREPYPCDATYAAVALADAGPSLRVLPA